MNIKNRPQIFNELVENTEFDDDQWIRKSTRE